MEWTTGTQTEQIHQPHEVYGCQRQRPKLAVHTGQCKEHGNHGYGNELGAREADPAAKHADGDASRPAQSVACAGPDEDAFPAEMELARRQAESIVH